MNGFGAGHSRFGRQFSDERKFPGTRLYPGGVSQSVNTRRYWGVIGAEMFGSNVIHPLSRRTANDGVQSPTAAVAPNGLRLSGRAYQRSVPTACLAGPASGARVTLMQAAPRRAARRSAAAC